MTTTAKVTLGILGAAAAGIVIGLLIAPEKGSEMRKRIKRTAGGWVDNLSHLFEQGKEAIEDGKEKVRHARSAAEEKVNKLKESIS
ncbi:MAG TPA: YtxH domain-containing protein [Chitinophagaceae bacterium]|nr:YtxH domain-containing protein [Chitinophagaceae bacterium]